MKKLTIAAIVCVIGLIAVPQYSRSQSIAQVVEQLALDYQKLSGLKDILKQMYQGYEIISKGYDAVKDVSQGNFSLHEAFLDGLMIVSPAVRKYPRVADIINDQAAVMSEYKTAWTSIGQDKQFSPDEVGYILDVYNNLVSRSLKNLTDLAMVMTDNSLRMSDADRLRVIDKIYGDSHGQLDFLRKFNNQIGHISVQRTEQAGDQQTLRNLYGIN